MLFCAILEIKCLSVQNFFGKQGQNYYLFLRELGVVDRKGVRKELNENRSTSMEELSWKKYLMFLLG